MGAPVKAKASRVATVLAPTFRASERPENVHTPTCAYCEQSIDLLDDSICLIPGQWMPDKSSGGTMFVLEPDVQAQILQLSNGQMALQIDSHTARHVHAECQNQMVAEVFDPPWGVDLDSEEDYQR